MHNYGYGKAVQKCHIVERKEDNEMRVAGISVHSNAEQATTLYESACSVFKSLPPAVLLTDWSEDAYIEWYTNRFTDTADRWHSGSDLMVSVLNRWGWRMFHIETPTTAGRCVDVVIRNGAIEDCYVRFADGSENAAGSIVLDAQLSSTTDQIRVMAIGSREMEFYPLSRIVVFDVDESGYFHIIERN